MAILAPSPRWKIGLGTGSSTVDTAKEKEKKQLMVVTQWQRVWSIRGRLEDSTTMIASDADSDADSGDRSVLVSAKDVLVPSTRSLRPAPLPTSSPMPRPDKAYDRIARKHASWRSQHSSTAVFGPTRIWTPSHLCDWVGFPNGGQGILRHGPDQAHTNVQVGPLGQGPRKDGEEEGKEREERTNRTKRFDQLDWGASR
ncbi:hypothetical protein MMC07_009877 [Pseudocyphellaria aurata]|nr:hypothetical protein [Pseudocyphellaria aurata]